MITAILCMTHDHVIGQGNTLPWKEPEEMQHFISITLGHTLVMGRKTYEGLFNASLPNRELIILSKTMPSGQLHKHVTIVNDIKELLNEYQSNSNKTLFICGGAQIYATNWKYCDRILLSILKKKYDGDVILNDLPLTDFLLIKKTYFTTFTLYDYRRKI